MKFKLIRNIIIPFIIGMLILTATSSSVYADIDDKRKSRISKRDNFTKNTRITTNNFGKSGGTDTKGLPPDPGDGDDGWPIPMGDGIWIILIGSIAYYLLKKKKKILT